MNESENDYQCYLILNDQQPGAIKSIREAIRRGVSPEEIADRVRDRTGVIRSLFLGAAYHIKRSIETDGRIRRDEDNE